MQEFQLFPTEAPVDVVAWGRIGVQGGGKAETAPRHMG